MQAVMPMRLEKGTIASGSIFNEFGNARHSRGTRTGVLGNSAIAQTLDKLLCDFESLAPSLKLTECPNIPQKVRDLFFILAREEG